MAAVVGLATAERRGAALQVWVPVRLLRPPLQGEGRMHRIEPATRRILALAARAMQAAAIRACQEFRYQVEVTASRCRALERRRLLLRQPQGIQPLMERLTRLPLLPARGQAAP